MNTPLSPEKIAEGIRVTKELVGHLLLAPDDELHPDAKALISKWSAPPKALEVLEVVDIVLPQEKMGSGFMCMALGVIYKCVLLYENKTHEQVAALATWRSPAAKGTTPDRSLS